MMNEINHHNASPEHLNIVLPITRSQYCFRLLRMIRRYFKHIEARFHFVYFKNPSGIENDEDIYRDCHELAETFLSGHPRLITVTDGGRGRLAAFTRRAGADLIMLALPPVPPPDYPFFPSRLASLLNTLTTPIFLLPDTTLNPDPDHPFNRILIHLEPNPETRLACAYALRAARRFNADPILAVNAPRRRHTQLRNIMEHLAFRYLPPETIPRCTLTLTTGPFSSALSKTIQNTDPDLIIVCNQHRSALQRRAVNQAISDMLFNKRIPLLVVRRFDLMGAMRKKFRKIYTHLSSFELAKIDDGHGGTSPAEPESLSEFEVLHQPMLLLGHYSRRGIETALERYGIRRDFERIGYPDIRVDIDTSDPARQRLRITSSDLPADQPLADIVFSRRTNISFPGAMSHFPKANLTYLFVEWICLQDPKRLYKPGESPLPGQAFPGLGFGWKALMLLYFMAKRMNVAGIYNIPEYYHSARYFHRFFHFVAPCREGALMAIDRDTFPMHPVNVSWAILHGLLSRHGWRIHWEGSPQLLPLNPALTYYFQSERYQATVLETLKRARYHIDNETYVALRDTGRLWRMPQISKQFQGD